MKRIYLDYAATTPVDPEVAKAMIPFLREKYGNPSSMHSMGLEAKQAVDEARESIAHFLNCDISEIIFTGNGTESNNIAILGTARANKNKGTHLITSKIEHKSVLNTFKHLEKEGFSVTYIDVDKEGVIDIDKFKSAITPETILTSIHYANNEIGTIQLIKEICEICKDQNVLFHTDACQAAGTLSIDVQDIKLDLMTLNASKVYGPKGIGALFIKEGTHIEPITFGGGQENNLKSGTHNTPGIIGFAKALELAEKTKDEENKRLTSLRDTLIKKTLEAFPSAKLNGHPSQRLPNNINISFPKIEGKELLLHLDNEGIMVSTGSACESEKESISHVLKAIGLNEEEASGSIRISLGKYTTEEDIDYTLEKLIEIVNHLSS